MAWNRALLYRITKLAIENSRKLKNTEQGYFLWDDNKFQGFQEGDYAFFINLFDNWCLFTVIAEMAIPVEHESNYTKINFDNNEYKIIDPDKKYEKFIKFKIISEVEIDKSERGKLWGQHAYTFPLWEEDKKFKYDDKGLKRIAKLKEFFKTGKAVDVLEEIEGRWGEMVQNSGHAEPQITPDNPQPMAAIFNLEHRALFCAIKTKPFILLAGISGTGKSRLVRQLAYLTCPKELQGGDRPGNFELVMVKPNWHDPTELMGYVSRIDGERYVPKDFLQFVVKAWRHPDVPFFLCLDEMNLAPVEHYFADYLSAIETRRQDNEGRIITDAILKPGATISEDVFSGLLTGLGVGEDDSKLRNQFMSEGITIPENLVVMGTVNMDETTHSFSRKVLDRAMTFEMNEVNLRGGLDPKERAWEYPAKPIDASWVIGNKVRGGDVPEKTEGYGKVLEQLEKLNHVLGGTPFKVAYRVRDEFLIYVYHNSKLSHRPANWLDQCLDELVVMKVLSRIEGDEGKVGKVIEGLLQVLQEIPEGWGHSRQKLEEMKARLEVSGYTSFWS